MTRLLTQRKQRWANNFKPNLVRGLPLNPNASIESDYYNSLVTLIHHMTWETEKKINRLFKTEHAEEYFSQDASIASQARILTNELKRKFDKLFSVAAYPIAETMANKSNKASSSAVHASVQKLSGGLSLPTASLKGPLSDILTATIAENVSLIKSIPAKYLQGVQGAVMRSITTGNGLQELVPYLAKNKGITLRRASMIAKDQTRKAMNSLSKGRMQNLGIEKYEWLHSGGSNEPRKLHIQMSGNIYSLDDPPIIDEKTGERGIPGQLPNCRCRMLPVIEFA